MKGGGDYMVGMWFKGSQVDLGGTKMVGVKNAKTLTNTFLLASWVGDTHVETNILPIGNQIESITRPLY